ncbi:glycosyltransferase [Halodurantibacterium flavum]|uniref:Glycosyltransferase n=1 Tax=Halodurantibacterium flavum TaxID=1382802 RepID=A0ABW4S5V8_9RHOB
MRFLRIIPSIAAEQGGPVEGMLRSAACHAALGHETEVLSLDPPDAAQVAGLPLHALGPVARRYGYTPTLAGWIAANAGRFDAAVVHGLWTHASVGGARAAARAGLPYVLFPHGMMDPWFRRTAPVKHLAKQALWWAGQGQALARAHAVLFTSEEERRAARDVFIGPRYRGRVVAYGAAGPPGGMTMPDAHLAGGRPFLLFLGRLHPKKGCDLALEGFARAAAPGLDLVLAGPDEAGLGPGLIARAAALGLGGRVHLPGMLQGEAKWQALRRAEALVLPSHQENFGIVVAEALACGTPVLISDKVNIWREVLADGAGLVAPDTVAGAARLIRDWQALGGATRAEMGRAARASWESRYRIEAAAEALLAVLQEVAGARHVTG